MYDDFCDVTGLKTTDAVLVYGNAVFPALRNREVAVARRGKDLTRFSQENALFSRIYVSNDVEEISNVGMAKLTSMNVGLLTFFLQNQEHQDQLVSYFGNSYPWHETWVLDTNVGRVLVTTAHGAPEWMD